MYSLHFFVAVLCVSVRKCVGYSKLLWSKVAASRVLAWARWQTSAMDEIPTRQCRAPDFSKWFVTDFCWPHDEERAAQLGRNSDCLRQHGVQVVADPLGRWLEAETMKWNDEDRSYSYEETVAHAEQALRAKSEDTTYVGMHAANLWVYKARGLQTTNMRAGDAWFPTGDGLI